MTFKIVDYSFSLGLLVILLTCYFVGLKWSMATELIIPAFGLFTSFYFFGNILWKYENPFDLNIMVLRNLNNQLYFLNYWLASMMTSNHTISVAGRALSFGTNIQIILRLWAFGDLPLFP